METLNNYISNLEGKTLTRQLDLIKKQITHFAKLSKGNLSFEERSALVAAWESVNELRFTTYARLQKLENSLCAN